MWLPVGVVVGKGRSGGPPWKARCLEPRHRGRGRRRWSGEGAVTGVLGLAGPAQELGCQGRGTKCWGVNFIFVDV